jgi:transcriptional regulator with XRE-family HTH domain
MFTSEQLRAARAMVRMEQTRLAERSGVSVETIKRLEARHGKLNAKSETVDRLRYALESEGVAFSSDPDHPGVYLGVDKIKAHVEIMTAQIAGAVKASLMNLLTENPEMLERDQTKLIKKALSQVSEQIPLEPPRLGSAADLRDFKRKLRFMK